MIDFHCHLDLYPDAAVVVKECVRRGLYVLCVTTTPSAWRGTQALVGEAERIRMALGLHPQIAAEREHELSIFDDLLPEARYVGEVGLDGAMEFRTQWASQVRVFEHILKQCSYQGGRIISIHSRHAATDVLDRLQAFPRSGTAVLHWFSGGRSELDRAINLGCWFSVGPAMLRGKRGREIVQSLPQNRVLTESDGPFAQMKGGPLMPWHVELAVEELSKLWTSPIKDVEEVLRRNLAKLLTPIK